MRYNLHHAPVQQSLKRTLQRRVARWCDRVRELPRYGELAQAVNVPDDRELIEAPKPVVDDQFGVSAGARTTWRAAARKPAEPVRRREVNSLPNLIRAVVHLELIETSLEERLYLVCAAHDRRAGWGCRHLGANAARAVRGVGRARLNQADLHADDPEQAALLDLP